MFCVGPSIPFTDKFPRDFDINTYISNIYNGGNWIKLNQAVIGPWCYLIKRSFWIENNLQFVEGIKYEDTECMSRSFYYVGKIAALSKFSVYNYIQHEGSTMNSKPNLLKLKSEATLVNTLSAFANNIKDDDFFVDYYRSIVTGAYIGGLMMMANNKELMVYFDEYMRQVHQAGKIYNMAQSLPKKIYRFIAIHFPRLFLKIC